ncbi:MAG TPA: hypothetical protein VII95_16805 [Terriglobales bacterium]
MADNKKGLVTAGSSLLWRQQAILWWVFAVNFVCGALGTAPAALQLNRALHHTLAGQALTKGFDLGMFFEIVRLPNVSLMRSTTSSYIFAFLFFLFMLFVSGGILETYRQDRRLTTGDFFAASGAFFWRFVRLMLFSLLPFIFLWSMYAQVNRLSDYVGDRAVADQVGFCIQFAGTVLLALLALLVRLWFDLAKVRAVAQNERSMWHNMWRSSGMTWRHLGTLFWMYFRISLAAWIALLIGLLIWTKLPPTAIPATFILLEFIILSQLAARLWQLASATAWYKRYAEVVPADSVAYTTPEPEGVIEVVETPAIPEPNLSPLPEPEGPPTGARTGKDAALTDDL